MLQVLRFPGEFILRMTGVCFLLVLAIGVRANLPATPPLERIVSIHRPNATVGSVLRDIEQQASITFSYRSSLVDENAAVSVQAERRSVRQVLSMLFGKKLDYRERGSVIILTRSSETGSNKVKIDGYVADASGNPVANATVFDPRTLVSARTNEYGYYAMRIDREDIPLELEVHKQDYHDSLVPLAPRQGALQTLVVEPDSSFRARWVHLRDSTAHKMTMLGASFFPDRLELQNVDDTIYRSWQLSFVPFVGTNRKLSGNVINDVSWNILAGYSLGVRGFEMGGLANVVRGDVEGVQLAGLGSMVGGNVDGVQASGLGGINMGTTRGVTVTGFGQYFHSDVEGVSVNGFSQVSRRRFEGVAVSGFSNVHVQDMEGVQVAGVANVNAQQGGEVQVSGFANVNARPTDGVLIAGCANITAGGHRGAAVSGFANVFSGDSEGVQLAGCTNIVAGRLDGVQVSGFLNVAGEVHGSQVGVFNIADTVSGVPFGFLSIVRKGYHPLSLGWTDLGMAELSWRTGVHGYYTFLSGGIDPQEVGGEYRWSYGYGIGTAPRIARNLRLQFELSGHHVSVGEFAEYLSVDSRVHLGLEWQFSRHFGIFGGAVYHGYWKDTRSASYTDAIDLPTSFIQEEMIDHTSLRTWIGWNAGIRIF